jgi:hypothetical protein
MKRAKYAVTAAAFLPAALALPVATQAAQAAPVTKVGTDAKALTGKSVKLNHSAAPATLGSCVATNDWEETYTSSPSFIPEMSGFYTPGSGSVCIGTVYVQRYFIHKNCASIQLNVYSPVDHLAYQTAEKQVCGNAGSEKELTFTIRQKFRAFGSPVYINMHSTYFNGNMVTFWPNSFGGVYSRG